MITIPYFFYEINLNKSQTTDYDVVENDVFLVGICARAIYFQKMKV